MSFSQQQELKMILFRVRPQLQLDHWYNYILIINYKNSHKLILCKYSNYHKDTTLNGADKYADNNENSQKIVNYHFVSIQMQQLKLIINTSQKGCSLELIQCPDD